MALSTYSELKTAIANWLNRSDLTTEISNDFIKLVESEFNSKLRINKMLNTDSSFTIDSETETLPTGFLQVRDFFIVTGSSKRPLTYMSPSQMDDVRGGSTTGTPIVYTIIGNNFRFAPTPDKSYTATINFYKAFDALSDSNTTNEILTNHPGIYLYGSWLQLYQTGMERIERNDREDSWSGAPLQTRSDVTVAGSFNDRKAVVTNSS